jgi:hypothetical protein
MLPFATLVVGRPIESFPLVRGTETTSRGNCRPDGVSATFQVCRYKVEPSFAWLTRNLFAKDVVRSALLNEPEPGGPEVPLVSKPRSFACRAERLARTTSSPDGTVIGPTRVSERQAPDTYSREEVTLCVSFQLRWSDILNAPLIDVTRCDMSCSNKIAEPLRSVKVNLVVVRDHRVTSTVN